MAPVYLLIAAPGSGKTWVASQLTHKFHYIAHDDYFDGGYVQAIIKACDGGTKPVLAETPFSISQIMEPLQRKGIKVTPVFIIEDAAVTAKRYSAREGNPIIQGHLTRIETYRKRAIEWGAKRGTSQEILEYLRSI